MVSNDDILSIQTSNLSPIIEHRTTGTTAIHSITIPTGKQWTIRTVWMYRVEAGEMSIDIIDSTGEDITIYYVGSSDLLLHQPEKITIPEGWNIQFYFGAGVSGLMFSKVLYEESKMNY